MLKIPISVVVLLVCPVLLFVPAVADDTPWTRHTVHSGWHTNTAVAADFTGDGRADVISNSDGKSRLFVAPDWREVVLDDDPRHNCIHSAVFDVDADGDPDYIAARYQPGLIFWLENPADPVQGRWRQHVIDDQVDGIHGLLTGDVDGDGTTDLIANSAQPTEPFPESVVWYRLPAEPTSAESWPRFIAADQDAPGLTHYMGLGDVNGDGRNDILTAAKGGPMAEPGSGDWFAWWEAPVDPTQRGWGKHLIALGQPGATNLHPVDVNADGAMDVIASRGHGAGVVWFEGPDWSPHEIISDLTGPHCLVIADIDRDGDPDAATCAKDDRIAAWFENDGRGNFSVHTIGRDQAAYDIRAVDMDGDQDFDLLVAGQSSLNVVWYENPLQ